MGIITAREKESLEFARKIPIPIGVSNRHVHLMPEDLARLFGIDYRLEVYRPLNQPGEFASSATVNLIGPKNTLEGVRVVGPLRRKTQVEVSITDAYFLGEKVPIRLSGDIDGTPGVIIEGPKGRVAIDEGLIVAARHIHLPKDLADKWGLKNEDKVRVQTKGVRAQIFEEVKVRVKSDSFFELHLDLDEANGGAIRSGDQGFLLL